MCVAIYSSRKKLMCGVYCFIYLLQLLISIGIMNKANYEQMGISHNEWTK